MNYPALVGGSITCFVLMENLEGGLWERTIYTGHYIFEAGNTLIIKSPPF